jgi:hypothetical protein
LRFDDRPLRRVIRCSRTSYGDTAPLVHLAMERFLNCVLLVSANGANASGMLAIMQ